MTKKREKKGVRVDGKSSVTDTELEMRAIPFFIEPLGSERQIEDTPTITEFAPAEVAEFEDDEDDDTATVECDFDDLADITKPTLEDEDE